MTDVSPVGEAKASRPARAGSLILLAGIGLYATWFSWSIGLWRGTSPGEGLFPFIAALAVTLLCLVGLAGLFLETRAADATPRLEPDARRRLGFYLAALLFYGGTLEMLGFFVSTILSLAFILKVAERYSWPITLVLVAGTVVGSYLLFVVWLGVIFPDGALWQVFD